MVEVVTAEPQQPTSDTSSAILVAVTRLEGKVDTALTVQAIHSNDISDVKRVQGEHGNRLTALETGDQRDQTNQSNRYSARALLWAALGSCAAGVSVAVAIVQAKG